MKVDRNLQFANRLAGNSAVTLIWCVKMEKRKGEEYGDYTSMRASARSF
jgi:hypothetical protein